MPVSGERSRIAFGRVGRARARCAPGGRPAAPRRPRRSHASSATAALSPERASRTTPRVAALGLLEVGVDQLGLDRLDVGRRVDAALGVDDVVVVVGADDVQDRVGLADVGQELVAEALALVRAGDEPGDVVDLDRVGDDVRGADRAGDRVEALVGDGQHRDVRLDRGERVVGRLGAGLRERVEQRRLAGVGHPDDADLHRPRLPTTVPSERARGDVGRVVHAEVQAAERHRERPPRTAARAGEQRRVGAGGGEAQVECVDGKLRPVGVSIRCSRSSTAGRRRLTASLIVLETACAPRDGQRRVAPPARARGGRAAAPAPPSANHSAPYSPSVEKRAHARRTAPGSRASERTRGRSRGRWRSATPGAADALGLRERLDRVLVDRGGPVGGGGGVQNPTRCSSDSMRR